jgi:hypothetical protein
MDYTQINQTVGGSVAARQYPDSPAAPIFDGVPQVAERAEMACDRLQRFLDRFHGCGQDKASSVAPVPSGHIGQLQRLAASVDRLERIAGEIDQLG